MIYTFQTNPADVSAQPCFLTAHFPPRLHRALQPLLTRSCSTGPRPGNGAARWASGGTAPPPTLRAACLRSAPPAAPAPPDHPESGSHRAEAPPGPPCPSPPSSPARPGHRAHRGRRECRAATRRARRRRAAAAPLAPPAPPSCLPPPHGRRCPERGGARPPAGGARGRTLQSGSASLPPSSAPLSFTCFSLH